ncbi:hypothetical protein IE53DRAFT_257960 [Violaceomyces palustris]|uniref:Uncharacterized protein n=1 Tax=Violaceomyces palustris TaxID=1673888 RepID=A0ACD0P8B8_9BASI|nr:hypothetical protein IE53DRAFT_257960 [Violaceomyces palustris]
MLLVKLWFIALSRSALAAILSPTLIHRQTSTIGPLHPLSKRAPTTNLTEEDCQDWKVLRCLIRRDLSAPNLNETFESLQGDSAFRVIHLGLDHANDHFDFCTQIVQRFNQLLEARSRGVPAQRFHVTKLDHDVFGIYSRNPARSEDFFFVFHHSF